jgi:hypothetical protein
MEIINNGKIVTDGEFKDRVWPILKKITLAKETTAHTLYLFVENMEKIEKVIGLT